MGREIERKYLVKDESWRRHAGKGVPYTQGYLSLDSDCSVRVRIAGAKAFLTIKGKSEGAGRDEFEYAIPKKDAEQILARLCIKPLIEKTRYVIRDGKHEWEIDEFSARNRGLVIAELELDEENEKIHKPEWLGEEVTGQPRYFNLSLVRHPYSEWKRE
ncbi:MAG TPA: CYTH domain-containing protein [Bryobacteraceae bacterium]|nr:CYTH domain-containing protein [Bryobacteraceae bacterium]